MTPELLEALAHLEKKTAIWGYSGPLKLLREYIEDREHRLARIEERVADLEGTIAKLNLPPLPR